MVVDVVEGDGIKLAETAVLLYEMVAAVFEPCFFNFLLFNDLSFINKIGATLVENF